MDLFGNAGGIGATLPAVVGPLGEVPVLIGLNHVALYFRRLEAGVTKSLENRTVDAKPQKIDRLGLAGPDPLRSGG